MLEKQIQGQIKSMDKRSASQNKAETRSTNSESKQYEKNLENDGISETSKNTTDAENSGKSKETRLIGKEAAEAAKRAILAAMQVATQTVSTNDVEDVNNEGEDNQNNNNKDMDYNDAWFSYVRHIISGNIFSTRYLNWLYEAAIFAIWLSKKKKSYQCSYTYE